MSTLEQNGITGYKHLARRVRFPFTVLLFDLYEAID